MVGARRKGRSAVCAGGFAAAVLVAATVTTVAPEGAAASTLARSRAAATRVAHADGPNRAGVYGPPTAVMPRASAPTGAVAAGAVPAGQHISGMVALQLRDQAGLGAFVEAVTDPSSSVYGRYLTPAGFTDRFGPSQASVAAVESALRGAGLAVSGASRNHLLVDFSGTAASVERAFGTGLERYRLAGGRVGYATTSAVHLPASVARTVTAVAGLDDLVTYDSQLRKDPSAPEGRLQRHDRGRIAGSEPAAAAAGSVIAAARTPGTTARAAGPTACAAAAAQESYNAVTDQQVAHAYGAEGLYDEGDLGSGETVDIFELEPFWQSDVSAFDRCYFGASHTAQITVTRVDGGAGTGEGSGEAALDVEDVSALAPGARIDVFEAPNSVPGSLDDYNAIVSADNARAVTTSWGLCEGALQSGSPGTQAIEDSIFEEAAAQGQSVFAAAGDDGSDDCANQAATPVAATLSVDDPGSQPYVISAGGTTFLDATDPPDETVWNDGSTGGAGGGGISATWPMPAWQADSGVPGVTTNRYAEDEHDGSHPYLACSNDRSGAPDDEHLAGHPTSLAPGTLCREVPDVVALADEDTGITVYYSGWTAFGGTSSAAPLWAAMTTDVDASPGCRTSADGAGFIAPALYRVAADPSEYRDAFNDITAGDNDSLDVGRNLPLGRAGNTYAAGTGYDLASGLGSPRLTDPGGAPGLAELLCATATATSRAAVTALSPAYGTSAGGTVVTITGRGFGSQRGTVQWGAETVPAADVGSWDCTGSTCTVRLTTPPAFQAPATDGPPGGVVDVSVVPRHIAAPGATAPSAPGPRSTFHYLAPGAGAGGRPIVEYVGPEGGTVAGGTRVHVIGSGFEASRVTGVSFGGAPGTDVSVDSDHELTVTTPPVSSVRCSAGSSPAATGACQAEVVVTTTAGASPTSTILPAYQGPVPLAPDYVFVPPPSCHCESVPASTEFDYSPPPTITGITPASGSALGRTTETIEGSGFNLLTYQWTNFGPASDNGSEDFNDVSVTARAIQVVDLGDASSLSQVGPAPVPTQVSVATSAGVARNGRSTPFAYAGVARVAGLSRAFGPTTGGQRLTIRGHGFGDATSVRILSRVPDPYGPQFTTVYLPPGPRSGTSLTIVTPAGAPGPDDVQVCTATGCSARTSHDRYAYDYPGRPVITSIRPPAGEAGTVVVIHGRLLGGLRAVYFGGRPARSWRSGPSSAPEGDPTEVIAVAPSGRAGMAVTVSVLTEGSPRRSAASAAARFTYRR